MSSCSLIVSKRRRASSSSFSALQTGVSEERRERRRMDAPRQLHRIVRRLVGQLAVPRSGGVVVEHEAFGHGALPVQAVGMGACEEV